MANIKGHFGRWKSEHFEAIQKSDYAIIWLIMQRFLHPFHLSDGAVLKTTT